MTDRERWTVYPLLFLALGVGLRSSGKFGPTKEIACHRLLIQGPDGNARIDLRAASERAIIQVVGPNGARQVLLESTPVGGVFATYAHDGTPLFAAEPTPLGVAVTAFGYRGHARQHLNIIPWNQLRLPSAKPQPKAETPGSEPIPAEPQQPAQDKPSEAGPDATQPPPHDNSGDNSGTKDAGGTDESPTPNEHE
jgi:hypothetical protein